MTTTNTEARAKLTACRRRMASAIALFSKAKIDDEAIVDFADNIVVSGDVRQMRIVKDWAISLGIAGVEIDPRDRELGRWTCCRIPYAALEAALAKAEAQS